MTQDKLRRIVTASVVAGITLLFVLLVTLIYQWITLGVLDNRIQKITAENQKYEQAIQKGTMDAEYYESESGLEFNAWQMGFVRPTQP